MKKTKIIYLLYSWYKDSPRKVAGFTISGYSSTNLCGAFTTKKQANYYCKGMTKNNKNEYVTYYIHPFYCNTDFYITDANGNCPVEKYNPKNKKG
jgi:hypothetical protein